MQINFVAYWIYYRNENYQYQIYKKLFSINLDISVDSKHISQVLPENLYIYIYISFCPLSIPLPHTNMRLINNYS